jgi:DNA-binding transcriptional ArsR family regulator
MAEGFFALQELDQLKALADPLRQRILQALCQEPMTTKQVAQQLGEKPTRLYHHVATLEQAGLIHIVETRQNRGTLEKYYQAVARKFYADKSLFQLAPAAGEGDSGVREIIVNALEDTLFQIRDESTQTLLEAQPVPEKLVFARAQGLQVTPEQITRLRTMIEEWLDQCGCAGEAGVQGALGPAHALTLVLYPRPAAAGR